MLKLNVLLAKTEHSASIFKSLITDYIAFFKGHQNQFKGVRKTYTPKEGVIDDPSMRGNQLVVTTVKEKLDWMEETAKEHIDNLFSIEATNASGTVRVPLIIEGVNFGEFSSLELLRLKSLLDSSELTSMYSGIPVRSDTENWIPTKDDLYKDRDVYELEMLKGVKKTIHKEPYIIHDPNLKDNAAAQARYTPQMASKDTIVELGDYTVQHFSGEATHRERATILKRISTMKGAVIEALKTANEAEVVKSALTSEKLFGYLHRGKI